MLLLFCSCCAIAQESNPYGQEQNTEEIKISLSTNTEHDVHTKNDTIVNNNNKKDHLLNSGTEMLYDSLSQKVSVPAVIKLDSTTLEKAKGHGKRIALDSLNNLDLIDPQITQGIQEVLQPIDSTTTKKLKNQIKTAALDSLNNQNFIKENPEYIGNLNELEQLKHVPKDSIGSHVKKEISERGESYLKSTDEYKALQGGEDGANLAELEEYKAKLEQIQQEMKETIAKDELKQKLASQGKQFVMEHIEQIQQIQEHVGTVKQKYSSIANSDDMENAVKRTSLEGEPAWKRIVLGGNINITKTNPLNIDFSPVIGYRFNKLFEAGVTAAYRTSFKANKKGVSQLNEEVFGFSVFASHMVFKSFFAYLEGERMRKEGTVFEIGSIKWNQTLLIGIGKKFHLNKWLDMQSMVVVNVLHNNKDGLYHSPVIFKTGFRKMN
ncbi:MAG: hypothetical protein M3512_15190 [Bacteroidota bacterium]|nr:hypothetical protein [Bacteroidota bacterium]